MLNSANQISPQDNDAVFTKVGYFSFEDNSRTNYQAREMKTIHMDIYT